MRVLVCGGRDIANRVYVFTALDRYEAEHGVSTVIEGGQRTRDPVTGQKIGGADWWGNRWAKAIGLPVETFCADWSTHGKAAGPIRNARMLAEGKPDVVIAFPGGTGTADMIRQAEAAGVSVVRIPSPKDHPHA